MDYDALMAARSPSGDASMQGVVRRVVGWVSNRSVESRALTDVGGWGGDFHEGHRWTDYITDVDPRFVAHHEALRREILTCGLRRGGDWHQSSPVGVPVFDDGAIGTFSFRAWGDLMAAVWSEADGRDYGYMHFYMDSCLEDAGIALSPHDP